MSTTFLDCGHFLFAAVWLAICDRLRTHLAAHQRKGPWMKSGTNRRAFWMTRRRKRIDGGGSHWLDELCSFGLRGERK